MHPESTGEKNRKFFTEYFISGMAIKRRKSPRGKHSRSHSKARDWRLGTEVPWDPGPIAHPWFRLSFFFTRNKMFDKPSGLASACLPTDEPQAGEACWTASWYGQLKTAGNYSNGFLLSIN